MHSSAEQKSGRAFHHAALDSNTRSTFKKESEVMNLMQDDDDSSQSEEEVELLNVDMIKPPVKNGNVTHSTKSNSNLMNSKPKMPVTLPVMSFMSDEQVISLDVNMQDDDDARMDSDDSASNNKKFFMFSSYTSKIQEQMHKKT